MKFRENPNFHCYYEPFHHFLLEIDKNYINNFSKEDILSINLGEKRHYLTEYEGLLKNGDIGIPYFNKSFIFDFYCENGINDIQKRYLDYLILNTDAKVPLFQFNRSALRIRWFKHNYPGSMHIYLVRNPRDQWESYMKKFQSGKRIFIAMDLMISGLNCRDRYFHKLCQEIPIVEYHHNKFHYERAFYESISSQYSNEEKYFIFYYIWFLSFLENVIYADYIININLLSTNADYKLAIHKILETRSVKDVDFHDAEIIHYDRYSIDIIQMEKIEQKVHAYVIDSISELSLDIFFKNLSHYDLEYFGFSKKQLLCEKSKDHIKFYNMDELHSRYQDLILYKFTESAENYLKIIKLNNQLHHLRKSYSYRVGKTILEPIRMCRRLFKGF